MPLPKPNLSAYPWCIVIPNGTGDVVLMRFKTEECAIENLELYQSLGKEAKQLKLRYREN